VLENRWGIGTLGNVNDVVHDLLIVPASREFGLFGLTDAVPVAAAARLAVEYVRGSFGTDADSLDRRAVRGVYSVPAGMIGSRIGSVSVVGQVVVGGAECLVVLLPRPRLGWLGPDRGGLAARPAVAKMLLKPGLTRLEVVVRPV